MSVINTPSPAYGGVRNAFTLFEGDEPAKDGNAGAAAVVKGVI